jgi:hypothetical protein
MSKIQVAKPSRDTMRLVLDAAFQHMQTDVGKNVVLDVLRYHEALWQMQDNQTKEEKTVVNNIESGQSGRPVG